MRLTKFTDYSLRVVIHLARHPEQLATIADIAGAYDIPATHLMKVVHRLAQRGYIATVRGKGGGMRLASAPDQISVGDLVRDMEDNMDIAECFSASHQNCPMLPACTLKSILAEARRSFLATLDCYRVSDIMGEGAPPRIPSPYQSDTQIVQGTARQRKSKT